MFQSCAAGDKLEAEIRISPGNRLILKGMTRIRVTLVSTSYPLAEHESSGVFVSRLVEYFPDNSFAFVVTPAVRGGRSRLQKDKFEVLPFNYAPDRWQVLAHKPGGIPVALKNNKWLYFFIETWMV